MKIFKRIFGICETKSPENIDCWSHSPGTGHLCPSCNSETSRAKRSLLGGRGRRQAFTPTHSGRLRRSRRWLLQPVICSFRAARLCSFPSLPALPTLLRWYAGKKAASLNRAMSDLSKSREDCEFVQTAFPFTKEFIATDGFYPSPAAYTMWAEQIATVIRQKWQ